MSLRLFTVFIVSYVFCIVKGHQEKPVEEKILANNTRLCYIYRTGTSDIIFGYNGRDGVVTDTNGLCYMRARYYSPDMRRFINADIIAGKISNAVTLNRYAYANGNPVSFIDPFGLWSLKGAWNSFTNWVSDTANNVKDWAVDTYNDVKDAVVETYNEVKDWAVDTYNDVKERAVDTYNDIKDWIRKRCPSVLAAPIITIM